ncbi:MAG: saccharopine dehydrogenase C-terminal domain-containing protein [Ferruginibacter sp.]
MKIAILGAGMVGSAIARDLSSKFEVTSFDISEHNLNNLTNAGINTRQTDLKRYSDYPVLLGDFDLVVSAVPGFMGYSTLKAIIESNKEVVDISFFPENGLELNDLAIIHNVTAIIDCGVAPGMSNLILGYYDSKMEIDSFDCMVGGLPKKRAKPFEYKAPFSPVDVIEEYMRPARYVENGHVVIKPAMSDTELIDLDHVGTLESFNTDGLRSILFTMCHIKNMKEKTLRYPGHIDLMKALFKAGFFDENEFSFKGIKIRPIEFTSALLFDKWKLEPQEEEFTIMKIVIKGRKDGKHQEISYFLYDEFDAVTGISSMSRTTGYTCTAAINLLASKLFTKKGIFPPELVAKEPGCFEYILNYLRERNVIYKKEVKLLS